MIFAVIFEERYLVFRAEPFYSRYIRADSIVCIVHRGVNRFFALAFVQPRPVENLLECAVRIVCADALPVAFVVGFLFGFDSVLRFENLSPEVFACRLQYCNRLFQRLFEYFKRRGVFFFHLFALVIYAFYYLVYLGATLSCFFKVLIRAKYERSVVFRACRSPAFDFLYVGENLRKLLHKVHLYGKFHRHRHVRLCKCSQSLVKINLCHFFVLSIVLL